MPITFKAPYIPGIADKHDRADSVKHTLHRPKIDSDI